MGSQWGLGPQGYQTWSLSQLSAGSVANTADVGSDGEKLFPDIIKEDMSFPNSYSSDKLTGYGKKILCFKTRSDVYEVKLKFMVAYVTENVSKRRHSHNTKSYSQTEGVRTRNVLMICL